MLDTYTYYKQLRLHTVITSNGSTYNAAKLMKSNNFELNNFRSKIQISSFMPLLCTFVMARLKINFGVEYKADVIHTQTITHYSAREGERKTKRNGKENEYMCEGRGEGGEANI